MFHINWTNGTGNIDSLYGLQKGIYELQVSDSSGCIFNEQLILDEPDSLILTFTNYTNPLICRGELTSIDAIAVGGTPPYFYNWSNNDTTFQSIIGAGTFYCNILDFKGCSISSSVEISEPNVNILAVQGPLSDDLMAKLFGEKIRELKFFNFSDEYT